jgi:hypothetical protein
MKSRVVQFVASSFKAALAYISRDQKGYYKFGETDDLPNQIVDSVNSSGTARLCVTRIKQFTKGNGLVDATLGETFLNNTQKANDVISDLALQLAYTPAVIGRVIFNNAGESVRFEAIQFPHIRRQDSKFIYNPNFGTKEFKKSENVWLDEFEAIDPVMSDDVKNQILSRRMQTIIEQNKTYGKQWGQIVFSFQKGIGRYYDVYPIPDYYSGIEDIQSDAKISTLEHRNVKKGWRTSVIISTGPIDNSNKDEKGLTDQDYMDQAIMKFTGEDASPVLHLQGETNEQKPTVTTIDIAEILDATDKATDRIGRKVCRLFTVPPVLAGFATQGQLGENQELKNSIDLFRLTVTENQNMITSTMKKIFPDKKWDITQLRLFDFIPSEVLQRLTEEEIREIFGLKPKPNATGEGAV